MSYCDVCFLNHNPEQQRLSITIPAIRQRNQFDVLTDLVIHYHRDVDTRVTLFRRTLRAYSIDCNITLPYQHAIQDITSNYRDILTIMFSERRKFDSCVGYQIHNIARIHDSLFTRVSILGRDIEELYTHFNYYITSVNQDQVLEEAEEEVYEIQEEEAESEEEDYEIQEEVVNICYPLLKSLQVKKKDVINIEDLECKICYDTTDINKRCILNCSHTLCIDCVNSHINSTDERQSTSTRQSTARQSTAATHYSCPICRANIMEIMANYVVSRSKKEDKSFSKKDLTSSESYKELQTKCNV